MEKANSIESATAGAKDEAITFTLAGALLGVRRTIPLAVSVFAVGLVFGVLARQAHLTTLESFLMSGLVFAGASQFVALSLWAAVPLPVIAIILTTLVVNLRHLLMGASLRPWFSRLSPLKAYTSVFFMVDESWALSMSNFTVGGRDMAFLPGSGVILFVVWVSSTIVGQALGSSIQDPAQWGLDFAFTAVFLALLTGMWKGKSNLLPWVVAAMVAVAAAHWLPGKWYILLGGLAGSITGAMTHAK
ncbi:MAG TPA: AzlC family ABC transporter permease [Ktedonobacteraceae bacterium]|nr:AzlC family ABC transporter permease [Ktedonobacteraceae bacterium]